jgi:hypothetical protein
VFEAWTEGGEDLLMGSDNNGNQDFKVLDRFVMIVLCVLKHLMLYGAVCFGACDAV